MKGKKKQLKRDTELRQHLNWIEQELMLHTQILQHWGALKMDQEGNSHPVFDHARNMPCSWVNTAGKCEQKDCNWFPDQCIFTGKFDQCKFYDPMIDIPEDPKSPPVK